MPIATKEYQIVGQELRYNLIKKGISGIIPFLPHNTGRDVQLHQSATVAPFIQVVRDCALNDSFYIALDVLINLMTELMEDHGWALQPLSNYSVSEPWNVSIKVNEGVDLPLVMESLLVLSETCEQGWALFNAKRVGLEIPPTARSYTIEEAARSIISKDPSLLEALDDELAKKFMKTLSRLTPPNVWRLRPNDDATRQGKASATSQMVLWAAPIRMMQFLVICNGNTTFTNLHNDVISANFPKHCNETTFYVDKRRELLAMATYNPRDPMATFQILQRSMLDMKPGVYQTVLASAYNFGIDNWLAIGFTGIMRRSECQKKARKLLSGLGEHLKKRPLSIQDKQLHCLYAKLALLTEDERACETAIMYIRFYQSLLASPHVEEFGPAVGAMGLFSWFLYICLKWGNLKYIEWYRKLMVAMFPEIRRAFTRLSDDFEFCTQHLLPLSRYHSSFAGIIPEVYFKAHYTNISKEPPLSILMSMSALANRLRPQATLSEERFCQQSTKLLEALTYAGRKSVFPGPDQHIYEATFTVGLLNIQRSNELVAYLSNESILDFCVMVFDTLKARRPILRGKPISAAIHLFTNMSSEGSLEVMIKMRKILGIFLRDSEKVIEDFECVNDSENTWNMDLIPDILKARLHVTKRIMELDSSRLVLEPEAEITIRIAVAFCVCSADREISARAIDCIKFLSEEITTWGSMKSPVSDFVQQSYTTQGLWQIVIKNPPTGGSSSIFLQKMIMKIFEKYPLPPVTAGIYRLTQTGMRLWTKNMHDVDRKLSPTIRKTLNNIMALICGLAHAMSLSSDKLQRQLAFEHTVMIGSTLASIYPGPRESAVSVVRMEHISKPQFCIMILKNLVEGLILPLYRKSCQPKDMGIQSYKGLSVLANEAGRLYPVAAQIDVPVRYDISQLACLMFEHCRHMYARENANLAEPFFQMIIYHANAENLMVYSKFDTFRTVATILFEELNTYPDHQCLLWISRALAAVMDDFTLYSSSQSVSLMDSRYRTFRSYVSAMARYLGKDVYGSEVAENIRSAIVQLCIANQDMAIVYFEEAELALQPLLRSCLYQCFTSIFSVDVDAEILQSEEIIGLLTRNPIIVEGMCEVCSLEESSELATCIGTLYCEYGHSLELAKWAFKRDLDVAQRPEELIRKNNVTVHIVLQIFQLNLKHKFHSLVRKLIRTVFDEPFLFLAMKDPQSEECNRAVLKCIETFKPLLQDPQQYFGDAVLKLTAYLEEQVEARFPGFSLLVFRNLLFLRVLCPRIVQPQSFGITPHLPEGILREALVNLAKFIQQLDLSSSVSGRASNKTLNMVAELKEQMIAKGKRETQFGFEENVFSAKAIDGSLYSLHQFFNRHARELKAHLYINANTTIDPSDPSVSCSGKNDNGEFSEESSLSKEFGQLIHRLGRPTTGLLNRTKRNHSSRSYTRKNSMVTWNDHDEPCVYTVKSNDNPVVVITSDFDSVDPSFLKSELAAAFAQFNSSADSKSFYGICDNTSCSMGSGQLGEFRDTLNEYLAESEEVLQYTEIIDLNSSFTFFKQIPALSSYGLKTLKIRFLTSLDLSVQELQQFGIRESTLAVARDIHRSEKFSGVMLEQGGATYMFTVYVGKQFIHVIGECNSCDVFTYDCVRFINGAIHLKKQVKRFSLTFVVKLGHSSAFDRKLWTLFNTTRSNSRHISPKPVLEVEMRKFYSYLLCQCMFDLCHPCPNMRYSSHNLLPNVISKFQLDMPDLDIALQTATYQPGRVAEISRSLAISHPGLVLDFLQSFITLCSHRGKIHYSIIEFITPWFQQLPVIYSLDNNSQTTNDGVSKMDHSKLETLTRSLCTLHDMFAETDPASRHLVTTYLWPFMMHSGIAPITFEVYLSYNIFRVDILNEKEGTAVYPVPMSSDVLRYIMGLAMGLLQTDTVDSPPNAFPRWSDNARWNRFKIVLLTFSQCIFSGPEQILEVLPELIVAVYCFSAVGPLYLRQNMHTMMNNMVNHCIVMRGISITGHESLRKLKAEINSDRGLLLYGAHESMPDDNYDVFDGLQFCDAARLCSYLMDFCQAILTPDRLSEVRGDILNRLYSLLPRGGLTCTHKVYFGILALTSSKPTPNQLVCHFETATRVGSAYYNFSEEAQPRILQALSLYYQIHYQQLVIWFDDATVIRYLRIALALQGLMIDPTLESLIGNITTCLRIFQMRGIHTQGITNLLRKSTGEVAVEFYERHQSDLLYADGPASLFTHFTARVSYPLIPLLRNLETRHGAFEAVEAWLSVLQADPEINSTLELALIYYFFAPEKRALAHSNLFGIYDDDMDSPNIDVIVDKLAAEISQDYTHGVVALLSVCQTMIDEPITSTCFKVAKILCKITEPRIVNDLEPILYPLCSDMVELLDTENHELTTMLANAITKLDRGRLDSYEESLKRLWEVLDTVGRPRDIDESFVLHPPKVHEHGGKRSNTALNLLKSVIQWKKSSLGISEDQPSDIAQPIPSQHPVLEHLELD